MSSTVASFAQEQIRTDLPKFRTGSTVKVHYLIVEGATKRVQIFEGVVIYIKNASTSRTFCVRKIAAAGIGVERIFPLNSPRIQKIEVVRLGKVRKARLYYLRSRVGKAAKVREQIVSSR